MTVEAATINLNRLLENDKRFKGLSIQVTLKENKKVAIKPTKTPKTMIKRSSK